MNSILSSASGIYKSQMNLNWQHLPSGFLLNNAGTIALVRNSHGPKEMLQDNDASIKLLNSILTNKDILTAWVCGGVNIAQEFNIKISKDMIVGLLIPPIF